MTNKKPVVPPITAATLRYAKEICEHVEKYINNNVNKNESVSKYLCTIQTYSKDDVREQLKSDMLMNLRLFLEYFEYKKAISYIKEDNPENNYGIPIGAVEDEYSDITSLYQKEFTVEIFELTTIQDYFNLPLNVQYIKYQPISHSFLKQDPKTKEYSTKEVMSGAYITALEQLWPNRKHIYKQKTIRSGKQISNASLLKKHYKNSKTKLKDSLKNLQKDFRKAHYNFTFSIKDKHIQLTVEEK